MSVDYYDKNQDKILDILSPVRSCNKGKGTKVSAIHATLLLDDKQELLNRIILLLSHGANPNERNEWGDTCLHVATKSLPPLIMELLLDHGASPVLLNDARKTPLGVLELSDPDYMRKRSILLQSGGDLLIEDGSSLSEDEFYKTAKSFSSSPCKINSYKSFFVHQVKNIFNELETCDAFSSDDTIDSDIELIKKKIENCRLSNIEKSFNLTSAANSDCGEVKSSLLVGDVMLSPITKSSLKMLDQSSPADRVQSFLSDLRCATTDASIICDDKSSSTDKNVELDSGSENSFVSTSVVKKHTDSETGVALIEEHTPSLSNASISNTMATSDKIFSLSSKLRYGKVEELQSDTLLQDVIQYPTMLRSALIDLSLIVDNWKRLVQMDEAISNMTNNSPQQKWREGLAKSCFNYILLNPSRAHNLPMMVFSRSEMSLWRDFVHAIFYVGKGSRSRPLAHLYEAANAHKKEQRFPAENWDVGEKVEAIRDIWKGGGGVICLQIFHNSVPVEAYTREAALIDSIGHVNLTNQKRGNYYGPAENWTMKQKINYGIFLLYRAFKIFLLEGEHQFRPADLRTKAC